MKDGFYAVSLADVVARIGCMDETQLGAVALAVMGRYDALFPQEEVVFLSLPKNDMAERKRILEHACRLAEKEIME